MSNWPTESRHARGYGRDWEKRRIVVLKRDGYLCQCQWCKAEGRPTPANQVDHIVSKARARELGWTWDQVESMDNLQAINSRCHERKTAEENGKTLKPRVPIGLDGYPK